MSVKPCIVSVLDMPFKHNLDPVPLTYISWSIDFVDFFSRNLVFPAPVIAVSVKPCILLVLDVPFKQTP